jgi:hypothetical protein
MLFEHLRGDGHRADLSRPLPPVRVGAGAGAGGHTFNIQVGHPDERRIGERIASEINWRLTLLG